MNINDLHQLPDSHPIAQRERISLAHIDVQNILRRDRERFEGRKAAATKVQAEAAAAFVIGQAVRTIRNDRGSASPLFGTVVTIEDGKVTLDNGQRFSAAALVAA